MKLPGPISENEKDLFRLRNACEIADAWSTSVEVINGSGQVIYPPVDNPPPEEDSEPSSFDHGQEALRMANEVWAEKDKLTVEQHLALAQVYALLTLVDRLVQLDTGIKKYFDQGSGGAGHDD